MMNSSSPISSLSQTCLPGSDSTFGPAVAYACRQFDFTLYFEQIFLSLVPSLFIILLSPIRVAAVARREIKTLPTPFHGAKLVATITYTALQLVLLVLWCLGPAQRTPVSIPASVLSLVAAAFICVLSHLEHVKTVHPSTIINIYLFFSLLFDAVQLRTLWSIHSLNTIAGVFSASFSAKATLLILEAIEKGSFLALPYRWTSPEALSSIYNLSVFWWLNRILRAGYKRVIAFDDLYTLDPDLQSETLNRKAQIAWDRVNKTTKHPLVKSTFLALKWPFLAPVLPRLCLIGFNYAQPFLINRTVTFVGEPSSPQNKNIGYGLIGATAITYFGRAIATGRYTHATYRGITVMRGALVSMIYSKTLKLELSESPDAPAVTLMSADVLGITSALDGLHDIWASTIEVSIGMYLLWIYGGIGFIVPLILAFVSMGLNYFVVGKQMVGYRKVWSEATQQRLGLTRSSLHDMKSLRMMGLGPRLQSLLQSLRIRELHRMKGLRMMIIWMNIVGGIARLLSPPFVLMIYSVRARANGLPPLNAAQAYTILSIISLTIEPLSIVLTRIPFMMSSLACFDRIQQYLLREERADDRLNSDVNSREVNSTERESTEIEMEVLPSNGKGPLDGEAILLKELSLGYSKTSNVVHSVTSTLKRHTITMIIGPVGAGKSSILLGLLGELRSNKGFIQLGNDKIGYCSQSAWLPNATIKQIITGTEEASDEVDEVWLESVLQACVLDVDIQQFSDGYDTVIGSRGLTLSGGQRQRLALARAVYQRSTLMLLDDIFSALDAKSETLVFDRLFSASGLFRKQGTTVILATHAVRHLRSADHIIAMGPKGNVVEQGTFASLEATDGYIKSLAVAEIKEKDSSEQNDKEEENKASQSPVLSSPAQAKLEGDDARRLGDFSVYNYYRKALTLWRLLSFICLEALTIPAWRSIQLLVEWWSAANGRHTDLYISIAFALPLVAMILQLSYLRIILVNMCPLASRRLHWILTRVVFAAPLSFFMGIDSGVILNRFSQDMAVIDYQLPIAVLQTVSTMFEVLWSLAILCYAAYYLAAFVPVLAVVVYAIQKFYLRTSRQIRILDLEFQSPLVAQFSETIEGLATIRAFGWQEKSMRSFLRKLDASQRPYYLLYCIQRWLNFVMDLVVAGVAILLVSFGTQFKNTTTGAAVGVGMLNVLGFGENIAALIQHWTSLETSIGAVARLKQLEADIKPENLPLEVMTPPRGWPSEGAVVFSNVSASYNPGSTPVLQDIDLDIKAGEKIGLSGRTGSGKSTMLGLLFRLVPEHTGTITIDNQDLSTLSREEIRSSIITIPQEPFLLSGSVRFNAAPHTVLVTPRGDTELSDAPEASAIKTSTLFAPVSDEAIIQALKKVALWEQIERSGGLDEQIDSIGLSHGQKQLFCLARALLRKEASRILVLDEATSSVDKHTDAVMRQVIEEEFKAHTVISVAHRLSSLGWCDRVVVLDKGRIVEVGRPSDLMKIEGGWWRALWDAQN